MKLRFIKQQVADSISVRDEIELVNCDRDSGYQNGPYTVASRDHDGSVTIAGKGALSGYIAVIQLDV